VSGRLDTFREHCQRMSTAQHKPECPSLTARKPYWPPGGWVPTDGNDPMNGLTWLGPEPAWSPPECDGCLTDADRALFGRLAAEVETYQQLTLEDA
jgi:hypothetical protein